MVGFSRNFALTRRVLPLQLRSCAAYLPVYGIGGRHTRRRTPRRQTPDTRLTRAQIDRHLGMLYIMRFCAEHSNASPWL